MAAEAGNAEPLFEGKTFPEWVGSLREPSPRVRQRAAHALNRLGRPARAIPVLADALRDVRWKAASQLSMDESLPRLHGQPVGWYRTCRSAPGRAASVSRPVAGRTGGLTPRRSPRISMAPRATAARRPTT